MSRHNRDEWTDIIVGLVVILILFACMFVFAKYKCYNKWEDSGYKVDHAFMKGCRLQKDGKWLPAESFRQF